MYYLLVLFCFFFFFFSSRRRHTRLQGDWSSDVCSSDLTRAPGAPGCASRPAPAGRRGGPARSAALEDRLPLLLERLRALLRVLGHGGRHADLLLLLERLRGWQAEARPHRALDRLHGEPPVLADHLGVAARLAHQDR